MRGVLSDRLLERSQQAQHGILTGLRLVVSDRLLERSEPAQQAIILGLRLVLSNRLLERSEPAQHGISIGLPRVPQTPWDPRIRHTNWQGEGNDHDQRDTSQD